MKIKEGVILAGLDIHMRPVLQVAEQVFASLATELVVTSGLEGTHSAGSLHYYGRALDFRLAGFKDVERHMVRDEIQKALGRSYDVVLEVDHLHVEYDP